MSNVEVLPFSSEDARDVVCRTLCLQCQFIHDLLCSLSIELAIDPDGI